MVKMTHEKLAELADELDADKHSPEFFAALVRQAAREWAADVRSLMNGDAIPASFVHRLERDEAALRWIVGNDPRGEGDAYWYAEMCPMKARQALSPNDPSSADPSFKSPEGQDSSEK